MPYSDEQRQFYVKAKEAGWEPEKIRAGIARIGERAAAAGGQNQAPVAAPQAPGAVIPRGAGTTPQPPSEDAYQQALEGTSGMEKFLIGMGGAFHGMGTGAQQIYAGLTGDEAKQEELRAQAAEHKRAMAPVSDTAPGLAGEIMGNVAVAAVPGGVAGNAARFGLPALMAAEGVAGAGMGALSATTEEGERAENALWGGALGAAIPAGGKVLRKAVGELDPAMKKAAETLAKYGIKTPKADVMPGGLSRASNVLLEKTPIVNKVAASRAAGKSDKVRTALAKMLGETEMPTSNEAMQDVVEKIGDKIGANTKGARVAYDDIAPGIDAAMKQYNKLPKSMQSPKIRRLANELLSGSQIKGGRALMKGEAYQKIRATLAAEKASAKGANKEAIGGIIKSLDDAFDKAVPAAKAAEHATAKEQYRLAKALRRVDIKGGNLDITKARNAVETVAKRGPVMKEARDLLDAANTAIPKISEGSQAVGMGAGVLAALNPWTLAKLLGLGVGAKTVLNTGLPQKAAQSEMARQATAKILRGVNQELIDED